MENEPFDPMETVTGGDSTVEIDPIAFQPEEPKTEQISAAEIKRLQDQQAKEAEHKASDERAAAGVKTRLVKSAKPPAYYEVPQDEVVPGTTFFRPKNKPTPLPPSQRGKDGKPLGFFGKLFSRTK